MTRIDRNKALVRHIVRMGVVASQKELGVKMGYENESYFSQIINEKVETPKDFISKLKSIVPDLNVEWLETGHGNMLTSTPEYVDYEEVGEKKITDITLLSAEDEVEVDIDTLMREWHTLPENFAKIIGEDITYVRACNGKLKPRHIIALQKHYGVEVVDRYAKYKGGIKAEITEAIPITSEAVTSDANTDIAKYVEENSSELETIDPTKMLFDANVSVAERIKRTSMLPTYQPDDVVFIRFIEDKNKIVDGEVYYFNCKNRPTMVRLVKFEGEDKLRLVAKNSQYGDIIIERSDIINVGEVVALFRMTFGDQYSEMEALRRKKDSHLERMMEMLERSAEQQSKLIDHICREK